MPKGKKRLAEDEMNAGVNEEVIGEPAGIGDELEGEPNENTGVYYIVNPHGAIHECDGAHARERLQQVGWRLATADEVKRLEEQGGNQVFTAPIGKQWPVVSG